MRKLPSSKDPLTDWIFREFVEILEKRVRGVHRVKKLKFQSVPLRGLWHYGYIYLHNPLSKEEIILTLIHEISHAFFHKKIKHEAIYDLEEILFKKFTDKQKEFLYKYAPEKISKTKSEYIRWTGKKLRLKLK
jgi:hypothetical protein